MYASHGNLDHPKLRSSLKLDHSPDATDAPDAHSCLSQTHSLSLSLSLFPHLWHEDRTSKHSSSVSRGGRGRGRGRGQRSIMVSIFWPRRAGRGSDSLRGGAGACFFGASATFIPVSITALWMFPKKLVGFRRTSPALCASAGPCFPPRGVRGRRDHDRGQLPSSFLRACFCAPTYAPYLTVLEVRTYG